MIGVFDSGAGGLTAIAELRRLAPSLDICFLRDEKNSPYGTKSQSELVKLVRKDIKRLSLAGADRILMACCTASTVHSLLPRSMRSISEPIIMPTAKEAASVTHSGRIGVIATEATVRSEVFTKALRKYPAVSEVFELPAQRLVSMVDGGAKDGNITQSERDEIFTLISPLRNKNIDTLILGCTHFPHLYLTVSGMLPGVKLVSSSKEGAKEIIKSISLHGTGKTLYL